MPPKKSVANKATKVKSTTAPKKEAAISVQKTTITITPDGIITIEKREDTVIEQLMSKGVR